MKQVKLNLSENLKNVAKGTKETLLKDKDTKLIGSGVAGAITAILSIASGNGLGKAAFDGVKWFGINYLLNTIAFTAIDAAVDAANSADAVDAAFSVNAEDVQTED